MGVICTKFCGESFHGRHSNCNVNFVKVLSLAMIVSQYTVYSYVTHRGAGLYAIYTIKGRRSEVV